MPVTNTQMSVDAKLLHHVSPLGDFSAGSTITQFGGPSIYSPDKRITIAKCMLEVVQELAANTTVGLGSSTAYVYATGVVADESTAGFYNVALLAPSKKIAAATVIYPLFTDHASNGTGYLHTWYYYDDNSHAVAV